EYYIGLVLDRTTSRMVLMGSEEGGMEIEEVAAETPEKIFNEEIDPTIGLQAYQARRLAFNLNIEKQYLGKVTKLIMNLYKAFDDKDCMTAEINPLVTTKDGDVMARGSNEFLGECFIPRQRNSLILRFR